VTPSTLTHHGIAYSPHISMRQRDPIGILTPNCLALPLATRVVECPHHMHFEQETQTYEFCRMPL
jgi:hypothetical protein